MPSKLESERRMIPLSVIDGLHEMLEAGQSPRQIIRKIKRIINMIRGDMLDPNGERARSIEQKRRWEARMKNAAT